MNKIIKITVGLKERSYDIITGQGILSNASEYLAPFVNTNLLISECLGLDAILVSGNIKLVEKPGMRKDRFSALAYGNLYSSYLDAELMREVNTDNDWDVLQSVTFFG